MDSIKPSKIKTIVIPEEIQVKNNKLNKKSPYYNTNIPTGVPNPRVYDPQNNR